MALASEAKHADVARCGPDVILPRGPTDLKADLRAAIWREAVTVAADIVAGPYFSTVINALERGGRYVTSGAIAGPIVELDMCILYLMDLSFYGSTVTPPQAFRNIVRYLKQGALTPTLAATYPLGRFKAGQQAFIDKVHTGNIVVTPEPEH